MWGKAAVLWEQRSPGPTDNELYQPSHGSIDQVRGNPDLSEEDIYSYDLSLEHRFGKKTVFNATLFRTDTRDMIIYLRDENRIYHPNNISRAYKQGVEIFLTPISSPMPIILTMDSGL